MGPGARVLSSAVQALGLRSVWSAPLRVDQHRLRWRGRLTPTPYSRSYELIIDYRLGHHPEVRVDTPVLEPNHRGWLPHYYHHNDTLCLYDAGEWNPGMHIAWTIVPWTVEWLFHYEIWKATGTWHGSGDDMEWADGRPLPDFGADVRQQGPRRRRHRAA